MVAWLLKKRLENFPLKNMKDRRGKTLDQEIIKRVLLPCRDYLHGDVVDNQFRAACEYEYARESKILRRAAELLLRNPTASPREIASQIEREFHCGSWFFQPEWGFIWQCPSFPAKGWNQLTEDERSDLLGGLPFSTKKARPLILGEVMFLTHYLDQLKEMGAEGRAELQKQLAAEAHAAKARAEGKRNVPAVRRREKVFPILELRNTPLVQVLLPLDFSKSKKRLLQEIDKWLELPENKARFNRHKQTTEAGTEKQAKDRLKDLAAWKLFDRLGWEVALDFAEQHRKCDKSGKPRAFHDPRQAHKEWGELKKVPPGQAPLYSRQTGESAFRKAKMRVDRYLAKLIWWEFGGYAQQQSGTFGAEMVEKFNRTLKEAQKTSKSSS